MLLFAFPAFAQESFDYHFCKAVECYAAKEYKLALTSLEAAKKAPGATKEQIAKATKFISQCKSPSKNLSGISFSKDMSQLDGMGQADSVTVKSSKAWEVTSAPEWAEVQADGDVIRISAPANGIETARNGIVEVTAAKGGTAYLFVTQAKRAPFAGSVRVRTIPDRALIYMDRESGALSEVFDLLEGRHAIRIEKKGYERKDTTVVIGPEIADGQTEFVFRLSPTFATISVIINPEDGEFDTDPVLNISGNNVNMSPGHYNSFNVDQSIGYYELYEGNKIPLYPGQYVLKVQADGYFPQTRDISVSKGSESTYEFTLIPVCGTLSVSDGEYAEGATVILDGKPVGTVPLDGLAVKKGKHKISFAKDGFITEAADYDIVVEENKDTHFKAALAPYSAYTLSSDPAYCKVYLDGELQGSTPVRVVLKEGEHIVRIEKTGYYPIEKRIRTDLSIAERKDSVSLQEAYPLFVSADKDSLYVTLSQGRTVYATGKTPATLYVPLSSKPYKLDLSGSYKKAWKGNVNFSDPEKNSKRILTWGNGIPIISGEWYLLSPQARLSESPILKGYKKAANAKFLTLRVFPGMSSSFLNASLYNQTNSQQYIHYPALVSGGTEVVPELTPESAGYENISWIPALTVLFLNWEFRMGGGVHQNMDVNLLAKYAWYPPLQFLVNVFDNDKIALSHMSGHDFFLGLELNSRIPVINAHLQAGVEGFVGQANIMRPGELPAAFKNNKSDFRYATVPFGIQGLNDLQFVVSLGFTLGGNGSRGQNVLRIF